MYLPILVDRIRSYLDENVPLFVMKLLTINLVFKFTLGALVLKYQSPQEAT